MSRGEVARRLLRLLRPLGGLMSVSATARIINQGLGVAIPAIGAALVVGFASGDDVGGLILILAGLALVKGTFRYIEQFTGHAVAFRLLAELRIDTFRKIVPLAPAGLEEDRTGDLVNRVVGDIDRVEPFYAHTIAPLASGVVVPLLTAIGLAVFVDPLVALVFVPFPLLMLASPWMRAREVASLSTQARDEAGETAAVFTDATQGAREIAVFKARDVMADRISRQSGTAASLRKQLARISAARSGIGDLLAGGAIVAVAAVGASQMDAGSIGPAALSAAVVAAWVGTTPARALEDIVPDLEQALASAARLFDLADKQKPIEDPVDPEPMTPGSISFKEVELRLGPTLTPALQGVDADIAANSYIGVVGPSGSGKSSLVEFLVRFRDPDKGGVTIGGTDLRELDPATLRNHVALVAQRPAIFYGTIRENLSMANQDATDEELHKALDRAALGQWVRSLEQGLDTTIGEMGETLSGGQRQRLALARAFLRDSGVLVLDEATSELDLDTEKHILDEIENERGERTVIVVAHRIESIRDADEILVLNKGRLVERGRHEDLISIDGVYAGLWQRHLDVVETV